MVSKSRYYVRTRYLGSVKYTSSTRTKGHFSAREKLPKYSVVPTCTVIVETPSRVPRYRAPPPGAAAELYFGLKGLATAAWMNPRQGFVLNQGHVCASDGAEKPCRRPRRRKRGLRKGKRRSRGRHPRRTASCPASVSKPPSARKVNHSGRKFLWAMRASESLRKDCKRYASFPVGPLPLDSPVRRERLKSKEHCLAKWTRLHKQAEAAAIPPVAAFHSTFWKYLAVETSRGRADWDSLLAGLPGNPATDFRPVGGYKDNSARGLLDRLNDRLGQSSARGPRGNKTPRGGRSPGPKQNRGGSRGSVPQTDPRR